MNYKLQYDNLIKYHGFKTKPEGLYTECHHIVPKCLGGGDDVDNLVYLTGRAHYIAHLLLSKLHPDNKDLLIAIVLMSKYGRGRVYEALKKQHAEARSILGRVQGRPVVTPKWLFQSITAAARAHGLSKSRMAKKLRSTSFTCRFYYFEGEEKKTAPRTGHGVS